MPEYSQMPSFRCEAKQNLQGTDDLLKTIHMPINLSLLQTVLPKSKYE
jgi:hypothetical protein